MERFKIYNSTKELANSIILNRPACMLSESEFDDYMEALRFLDLVVKNSISMQIEYQNKED